MKKIQLTSSLLLMSLLALPAAGREVIHLHLPGATARHAPVVVVLEVDGSTLHGAAVAEPYRAAGRAGSLEGNLHVDAVSTEHLSWDGTRLQGRLALEDAFAITLDVTRDAQVMRGAYKWRDERKEAPVSASGEVRGMWVPVPKASEADHLTLYLRNPVPGHPDGGRNNRHSRGIAAITLQQGAPKSIRLVDSNTHAASRHTRQSFPVTMSGGAVGYQAVDESDDSDNFTRATVSRDGDQWRIEATYNNKPVRYLLNLQNVGDMVFGHYEIEGDPGHGHQEVAGHLGKSGHLTFPVSPRDDAPRGANELQTHLRWLLDVNAYGGGLFGNDMALGDVRNTGSKDYNDPPMVGAFGPMAARAVLASQDDPLLRARALMIGQRGGHYILSHRVGPYNLLPTYKTMFRPQYWMGRSLVDLAVISESDFWKARALEVGDALRRTQDEHGSWSYVDARDGEIGTTLSRGDRSWDNVPRANGMWLDLLGRIRTELGVEDYRDVEDRAAAWMRTALLEGATHQGRKYLIEGRSPNSSPDDDGPTFYALYQLRYADTWDQELFDATIEWAELLWFEGNDRLPRIQYDQPRGPAGMETVGTMRMALIYALSAEKTGNAEHLHKAGLLFHTVETMYKPQIGVLWDSPVWNNPNVSTWSYHAYAALPAEVALNLIDFMEVAERLEKAGRPIPVPQRIDFPDIADQPAEAVLLDPGATSDAGLTVRYGVDQGPATVENGQLRLSGETGIVWVTAYQDGTDAVLPALSRQRNFAVGEAAPPPPPSVSTRSLNNRAVEISWEPSDSKNLVRYTVEQSRDDGASWQQAGRVDAETLQHEVSGLQRGETRLFRVLAHNPSFASDPSPVAEGGAHAEDFHVEIDFDKVSRGKHWELRAEGAPEGGPVFVPTQSSRSNEPDPDLSFSFTIDIGEQTGRYDVYYQCWGNAGSNDSAWIRTQNDDKWHWISIGNQEWAWRHRGLDLNEPGEHTIYFGARQHGNNGPRIARIIVTNTASRNQPEE
ncbi:MAG: fibronectin type III domain-containing protein [Verrucomicrobia bacterium]|nr:fibronectin type III domain-containing protein [Verrucomicrobiota bacterium]MCH8512727.1 fibronectin type III domain-containing protein [Kiritimatiellia bacterium]